MDQQFIQKLRSLGKEPTSQTICLENTRLGEKYLIFDLIAVGKHSAIYYGIQQATKEERIFKFYNLKQIEAQKGFKEKEVCKRLSNYQYTLRTKCSSIHIIKQYDIYQDRSSKIIVSQYCNLGSLQNQIKKRAKKQTDQLKAIAILKQIVTGIKNIHKNCGIIHKNLKPKNILVQDGIYKIIDLGFTIADELNNQSQNILIPQIMLKKDYDIKAEIWNIGVIFHQILLGELPASLAYNSHNILISSAVRCIFQSHNYTFDPSVKQFLQNCLQTNPQKRMSWQQLQNHRMFQLLQPQYQTIKHKQHQIKEYQVEDSSARMSVILAISQQDQNLFQQRQAQSQSQRYSMQQSMSFQIQVPNQFYSRKFNLEKEMKMIESELEEPYKKLGLYFEFKQLQPISWMPLRKAINKDIHIQYEKLKKYYLQCLKVDFVYYDIIARLKKIEDFKQNRQQLQFIYLLICRCFFEMSKLNVLSQNSKFQSKSQNILVSCIKKQTERLYNHVKKDWDQYSELMSKQENKISSIIMDRIRNLINKQGVKRKDIFLSGIQDIDFKKEDQIEFTFQLYKPQIRQELHKYLQKENSKIKDLQMIIKYLDKYIQVWNINSLPQAYLNVKQFIDADELQVQEQHSNNE